MREQFEKETRFSSIVDGVITRYYFDNQVATKEDYFESYSKWLEDRNQKLTTYSTARQAYSASTAEAIEAASNYIKVLESLDQEMVEVLHEIEAYWARSGDINVGHNGLSDKVKSILEKH